MDLKNRKVICFRTYYDPMVGGKPKQAFHKKELKNWEFELTPIGMYVKAVFPPAPGGVVLTSEYVIPYENIQCVELAPAEEKKTDDKKVA